jgi:nucleotide-binding universal stress UspA family protein
MSPAQDGVTASNAVVRFRGELAHLFHSSIRAMKPFSKILVPVDFSPHSSRALQLASDLSRRYDAGVELAHVYHPMAYALPDGFVLFSSAQLSAMLVEFGSLLEQAKQEALAAGAVRVSTKLLQGVPFAEIIDFAQESGCDLIVMGTHGRTGLKHALLGSVTERVVRKAPCPVLTVRLSDPRLEHQ